MCSRDLTQSPRGAVSCRRSCLLEPYGGLTLQSSPFLLSAKQGGVFGMTLPWI